MSSLTRLSQDGADGFESALLRSARSDGASAKRERTLAALAAASAATATAATGAAGANGANGAMTGAIKKLGPLRRMAMLGLAAVGGVAGWAAIQHRARPDAVDTATAAARPPDEPVAPATPAVDQPTLAPPPLVERARPSAQPTTRAAHARGDARAQPNLAADSLLEEVSILDRCRQQLAAHDGPGATQTAETYQTRFPHGRLANEAAVVRIQAALLTGGRTAAAPLAEAFLRQHPDSPHAPALRRILLAAPTTAVP